MRESQSGSGLGQHEQLWRKKHKKAGTQALLCELYIF